MMLLPCILAGILLHPQGEPRQPIRLKAKWAEFRVLPYLVQPSQDGIRITWFTHEGMSGKVQLTWSLGSRPMVREITSRPQLREELGYSALEESERSSFPDMQPGPNWKHSVLVNGLPNATTVRYKVTQGASEFASEFRTAPPRQRFDPMRIIAFADSETDPEGRVTKRPWAAGTQHPDSTGRPEGLANYLLTETDGFRKNLEIIGSRRPSLLLIAGDIVQGGGYQRAWDEFFYHMAGPWDTTISKVPLVPAIGNWECFGARNGGYEPWAIHASRRKYLAYFDSAPNGTPEHQNVYHRVDYGPVTILTLDSSNGLPDNTDNDTNRNIDAALYPGRDLPDISVGSPQWKWAEQQLASAKRQGQIILVQFHHIPYSGGGHSLPLTAEGSSGQAGLPMRAYQALFHRYGVVAVLCGHNESFEASDVDGVLYFDAGVAGDGLGIPVDDRDPRRANPWRRWVAHFDEREYWIGKRLVSGGKHYGHLEIDIERTEAGLAQVTLTPVHAFPVTDAEGRVGQVVRRPSQVSFRRLVRYGASAKT